eukprot:Plantae.Rhodophyta-Rhodochaete_pulchella.ctg13512.p1 GENE.Plantae.Rhodophyta-Rhodochaete_pulchella.ctg13512~~Plantae.Rhodophyta-Rhodochaete_pulchella.ctg13512.p1  ORF type:complete len:512 (-),score=39.28 Plantae.Rhodophyta-Rhodochaete_pulchella.ctg13512:1069-2397(-)
MDVSRMALDFSDRGKENSHQNDADSDGTMHNIGESLVGGSSSEYNAALASSLLQRQLSHGASSVVSDSATRILSFKHKPQAAESSINTNSVLYSQNATRPSELTRKKSYRYIPQAPEKILDAPDFLDDYYLNLLDWNQSNVLAVALGQIVYLWNASTGSIDQLCELSNPSDYITSVAWIQDGNHLAVGTSTCDVQLWDTEKVTKIRSMRSHSGRVGSLAWNGPIISSGSRDATIHNHDVRHAQHHISTLACHQQEVCGLKWSPSGTQLASGGNDNLLCIWDAGQTTPRYTLDHHTAAVKAIAWCPWQNNLLATGGGTADRTLRFWNTASGVCTNSIDTKSQVCSIVWNRYDKELVTSHGFSQNQLTVWKYPSMARIAELNGHTARVLHMALGPDGQTVVSGAADETLRFWKVFAGPEQKEHRSAKISSSKPQRLTQRLNNIR